MFTQSWLRVQSRRVWRYSPTWTLLPLLQARGFPDHTGAHTHTQSGPHCQGTPTRVLVGALHLALGAAPPLPTGPPAHTLQRRHWRHAQFLLAATHNAVYVKHYVVLGRLECYITGKVMVSVTSEKAVIVDSVEHQAPRRHKGLITSLSFHLH